MTSQVAGSWSRLKCLIYRARILVPAILLLAFGLIWCALCPSEQAFRWWGLSLQGAGLLLVYFQLLGTAKSFGHPAPLSSVCAWVRDLGAAFAPPRAIHASANIMEGGDIVIASATLRVIRPNRSMEDRLDDLDAVVEEIRNKADELNTAYVQRLETIELRFNSENQSNRTKHEVLANTVTKLAVGDLNPGLIGVFLTLVGTVASTLPQEQTCLFGG